MEKYRFVEKKCGNVVYLSEYDRVKYKIPLRGERSRSPASETSKKTREDSIKRARRQIFSIVEGNFDRYELPVFITLTYEKNVLDLGCAIEDFRLFLRRYSRSIFSSDTALDYLAVAERQDRGAVHFHVVLFNLPRSLVERDLGIIASRKIHSRRLKKQFGRSWTFEEFLQLPEKYFTSVDIWGLGFSDMRTLEKTLSGQRIKRVSAYVAKYLGKDNIHRFGLWNYLASRRLLRPTVRFSELLPDIDGDIVEIHTTEILGKKLKITKYVT